MSEFGRRDFLTACVGLGAAGALTAKTTVSWPEVVKLASNSYAASSGGILVLLTMYGGNDGVNTVIPLSDDAYHDARPDLAYAPEEAISLNKDFGLNAALTGMADLFGAKKLAIVHGVGYPDPDRSHFRSMDIWQTGSTDNGVKSGWVGRWLDQQQGNPVLALNIGSILPRLVVGERTTAAAFSSRVVPSETAMRFVKSMSQRDPTDTPAREMVRASYRNLPEVASHLGPMFNGLESSTSRRIVNAGEDLRSQLSVVADCIAAGLPTRVYSVSIDGFDTHANERGTHQDLLGTVDSAVTEFLREVGRSDRGNDVVVMAYSEFGRRVSANASDGTDHGTAGPVLVVGNKIKGGFYGEAPALDDLDDGNLKVTTDFRDVYGELIERVLNSDPGPVIGTRTRELGFLTG